MCPAFIVGKSVFCVPVAFLRRPTFNLVAASLNRGLGRWRPPPLGDGPSRDDRRWSATVKADRGRPNA
jgi:hypothetical protein